MLFNALCVYMPLVASLRIDIEDNYQKFNAWLAHFQYRALKLESNIAKTLYVVNIFLNFLGCGIWWDPPRRERLIILGARGSQEGYTSNLLECWSAIRSKLKVRLRGFDKYG